MNNYVFLCKGVEIIIMGWLAFSFVLAFSSLSSVSSYLGNSLETFCLVLFRLPNERCFLHLISINPRELGQADVFFRS